MERVSGKAALPLCGLIESSVSLGKLHCHCAGWLNLENQECLCESGVRVLVNLTNQECFCLCHRK